MVQSFAVHSSGAIAVDEAEAWTEHLATALSVSDAWAAQLAIVVPVAEASAEPLATAAAVAAGVRTTGRCCSVEAHRLATSAAKPATCHDFLVVVASCSARMD